MIVVIALINASTTFSFDYFGVVFIDDHELIVIHDTSHYSRVFVNLSGSPKMGTSYCC